MSFSSMAKSLAGGEIPGVSETLAKNKLNEALGRIYDERDWSFQTQESGWNNPGLVASGGTVTVAPYSAQIIGDATATANWATVQAGPRPKLTELQFRDPSYALYDIVAYDTTSNPPFATLSLDRAWLEPTTGAGRPYQIYQAYFPVPVADFRKFVEIRDTTFSQPVDFWTYSRDDLSFIDPERLMFGPGVPTYAVAHDRDQRAGSATLGYVRYEIWPHNLSHMPYSFGYKRRGALLVNLTDTVPDPLTEELLMWRAKEVLYQYCEAQKGQDVQRGAGANWQFLAESAAKEYKECLKYIKSIDANLHRDFLTRKKRLSQASYEGYSTERLGQLNIGR